MSLLEIKEYPHPSLRETAQHIDIESALDEKLTTFMSDLMDTLEDTYPLGAGLSANQVDTLERVFAINLEISDNQFLKQVFINPRITATSKETSQDWEGCLSFPDQWGLVTRPKSVTVKAFNIKGEEFTVNASNFYGRLIQHEIDHLDGVLFIDKLDSEIINTKELRSRMRTENEQEKEPAL